MYRQFNIHKFYVLPTMHLCVLYGSQNKQRLFPYTALTDWFYNRARECLLRDTSWVFKSDCYSSLLKVKVKIKQSRYRPEVAQRVPGS